MQKYFTLILCLISSLCLAQEVTLEGYAFEAYNRGYLNNVYVRVSHPETGVMIGETHSNVDGFFTMKIPPLETVNLFSKKSGFIVKELDLKVDDEKLFVKLEMLREPGYQFEVTLAEVRESFSSPTKGITDALIEVYNNTDRKEELVLDGNEDPEFDIQFKKGNHYTILIRKPGYLSKRMEAFVDVEGCILCFEGVGSVQPGVADNLTDANSAGVLLANVELEPIFEGKTLEIENIYYGLGKYSITKKAREQLDKVILLMDDNPHLTMELGSHTDSRGKSAFNKKLSIKRANASAKYIIDNSMVDSGRLQSRGYGEEQISNKCSDGVKCTEEEHAVNRRTELKILGIGDIGRYKPLAQMKAEEQFEQGLGGQEELVLREGETLEDALARVENKEATEIESEFIDEDVASEIQEVEDVTGNATNEVEPEIMEKETEEVMKEVVPEEETIIEDETDIETIVAEPIKDELVETEVIEAEMKETMVEKLDESVSPEEIEVPSTSVVSDKKEQDAMDDLAIEKATEEVVADNSTDEEILKLDDNEAIPEGSISKVVIMKAPKLLKPDHEIFSRHEELDLYFADDNTVWYMLSGFKSKAQAQDALGMLRVQYPDAYIVQMIDGNIY